MPEREDRYGSFAELARHEAEGCDYRIHARAQRNSRVLIVAPHGGLIEMGTSEIARLIAGNEHNLFIFEGLKSRGANRDLHITSHRFDHPTCLGLAAGCSTVVSVHGCIGQSRIHVGGLDADLSACLASALEEAGFGVDAQSRQYPGRHPLNICNRGTRRMGAQLEVTYDLRNSASRGRIAAVVRAAVAARATVDEELPPASDFTSSGGRPGDRADE